ncbi:hypothetical protein [Paraburkholderia phenoliruptrix]|uniref:hypothetical protein n=1 Tax=Paraburkholderia phenoliruptrix TaxID=252970 RepID=UPI001C6DE5D6|nr:hypothetical protein [Paraburkholderia phenoliruptrix]MBW9102945.1 hypothetical protein [Paraburkholderia phenoliruptrix]MBW9132919.1 hypothetical protein [Paraburkholderia ginsengiterrae]
MSNLLRNLTSRGLSFAHLAKVPARAGDDTPPPDDKGKNGKSAEGDDQENNDQNHENGDARGAGAEGDDQPPENGKGGKNGKAESDDKENADDDDDEEEMRGSSASAQARRRERMRCATIMGSAAAGKNPVLAANLAFNTSMTRKEALAVLGGTPAPAAAAPVARRNPQLGAGGERGISSEQAIASSWETAMQRARPPKR